jgi:hypothetical protein
LYMLWNMLVRSYMFWNIFNTCQGKNYVLKYGWNTLGRTYML